MVGGQFPVGDTARLVCDAAHDTAPRQNHQRAIDLFGHHGAAMPPAHLGNSQAGLGGRHRLIRVSQNRDEMLA